MYTTGNARSDGTQNDEQQTPEDRTLALVLGGGGGKGGAHLGVISALESLGLPIDMIVGASIGGVVGALYAAGYSVDEISQSLGVSSVWRLFERDTLGMGFIGTRRIKSTFEELLGDCTFEQLSTPCAVVATDLVTGRPLVIDSGSVVDALMATIAFPGIFPPVQRDTMLLADGGVSNNLPVDVAYARGAGKVIAVDLGAVCDDFQLGPQDTKPAALFGLLPNAPLAIANRGLSLMMAQLTRHQLQHQPPDLLLCPVVEHIGVLDFARLNEGHTAGEAAAVEAIRELLAIRDWRTEGLASFATPRLVERAERELAVGVAR